MEVYVHAQLAYEALHDCCVLLMFCFAAHAVVFIWSNLWLAAAGGNHLSFVGVIEGVFSILPFSVAFVRGWGFCAGWLPWCGSLYIGWQLGGGLQRALYYKYNINGTLL